MDEWTEKIRGPFCFFVVMVCVCVCRVCVFHFLTVQLMVKYCSQIGERSIWIVDMVIGPYFFQLIIFLKVAPKKKFGYVVFEGP